MSVVRVTMPALRDTNSEGGKFVTPCLACHGCVGMLLLFTSHEAASPARAARRTRWPEGENRADDYAVCPAEANAGTCAWAVFCVQ